MQPLSQSFCMFFKLNKAIFALLFFYCVATNVSVAETKSNAKEKNGEKNKVEKEINKNNDGKDNAFVGFMKTYIFPEKNPIFQDKKNELYISYYATFNTGEGEAYGVGRKHFERAVHSAQFHYAQPNKLLRVHGRLSVGVFTWHGVAGEYKHLYQAYGIEAIQEMIFGTPMLYLSAGIGPSFAMGKKGLVYGTSKGLTGFNFSSVVKIGHRFNCGAVIEIAYHHYSNGGVRAINQGLDMIGMSFGWVF